MKFSFKRFLGSALAAVMTVSVLSVGMVTSVSAAENYPNSAQPKAGTISFPNANGNTSKDKKWDFLEGLPDANFSLNAGDTVHGIIMNVVAKRTYKGGTSQDGIVFRENDAFRVPVPKGSKGNINLVFQGNSGGRMVTVESNAAVNIEMGSGNTLPFTAENTDDGYIDVSFSTASGKKDGDRKLQNLTVTIDADSNFTFDVPPTYTLTGSCTGLESGVEFTLKNETNEYTVKADGNGSYTASVMGTAFVEGTYTAVLDDYDIAYADSAENVTISKESGNAYTVKPAINFTKLYLTALESGVYYEEDAFKGLPNFDTSGLKQKAEKKINDKESLGFMVKDNAKVTVKWHTGTTDPQKGSQPSIRKKGTDTDIAKAPNKQNGLGEKVTVPVLEFSADNLAAGEYIIYSDSPSTSTRIDEIIVEYPNASPVTVGLTKAANGTYAFAGINEKDAANYDSIDICVSNSDSSALGVATNGKVADTTTTVYGEVADVATPAEVSGKKIFAVLITGTPTNGAVNIAAIAKSATNGNVASSNIVTINAQ